MKPQNTSLFSFKDAPMPQWKLLEQSLNTELLHGRERPEYNPDNDPLLHVAMFLLNGIAEKVNHSRLTRLEYRLTALYIVAFLILSIVGTTAALFVLREAVNLIIRKIRRASYYDEEARRRAAKIRQQRSDSHRIRHRHSIIAPPSPEEVLSLWEIASRRGFLKEKLILGSRIADLEATVDNSLIRDESGTIIGRKPGIKGWFEQNCPSLLPHYGTILHYKELSDKTQKVCHQDDPYPAALLLQPSGDSGVIGPTKTGTYLSSLSVSVQGKNITINDTKITVGPKFEEALIATISRGWERMEALMKPLWGISCLQDYGRTKLESNVVESNETNGTSAKKTRVKEKVVRMLQNVGIGEKTVETPPRVTMQMWEDVLYQELGLVREKRLVVPLRRRRRHSARKTSKIG